MSYIARGPKKPVNMTLSEDLVREARKLTVESRRGAVLRSSPFPLPAHQTGRADFPHPAFRLAS